jgi:hypothetical protein
MTRKLEKAEKKNGRWYNWFECLECNSKFITRGDYTPQSCGCLVPSYSSMELPENSKWQLLEPLVKQKSKVLALCTLCNKTYKVDAGNLVTGKSVNCFNCGTEKRMDPVFKHIGGVQKHQLYKVWDAMVQRCTNPNASSYKDYGGRGVTVCDEWLNSSSTFIQWAEANNWKHGLQIDKDKLSMELGITPIYSPETCCFLTPSENSVYTRLASTNTSGVCGVSWCKAMKKYETYFNRNGTRYRAGYHNTIEEAALALIMAITAYNKDNKDI